MQQMPQMVAPQMPMPGMPMPQAMPGMMPGMPMTPAMEYQQKAAQLLPSIQPNNRVYKQKVGELIFPFISKLAPADRVPRLTGMLIELPIEQVREYLGSFQALQEMVAEGNSLIESQQM